MTRMFGALACVLALVAAPAAAEEADYYEVLGVSKQTTPEEVKVRFKKLARLNHPDRFNTDTEIEAAKAKMQLINEAKDTLSDPDKRHKYDMMMSKLSAIQAFAELPTVVVIYLACPAYLSFKLSSLIASILCTGMLVSHFPILVVCYLFYKYAMWGPIPEEKRDSVMRLSIFPRIVMFLTLAAIATLLMLSCMEYTVCSFVPSAPVLRNQPTSHTDVACHLHRASLRDRLLRGHERLRGYEEGYVPLCTRRLRYSSCVD